MFWDRSAVFATATVTALLAFATPQDASACGGLFCSGGGPQQVNQAAERIIFSKNADGTVTAVVQILYDGPADRFGWVLPVPGVPEVGLSSNLAFTRLQNATNPTYQLNTTIEGECKQPRGGGCGIFGCADSFAAKGNDAESFNNGAGGIEVLDQGSAGPYDFVVIQVDSTVENNVQLALDWLDENNYEVTDVGPDLIKPYLDDGYNLLAIRLQKSSDTGSIRPIKLTYETDHPMIPIKLTAVAANEDMGVLVWILGDSRAVPVNYKALEINDAILDWFQPQNVYNDVIIMAANEASGQGFVTEHAQPATQLSSVMFTQAEEQQWSSIREQVWTGRETALIDEVVNLYASGRFVDNFGNPIVWDGVDEAIDAAFPTLSAEQKEQIATCGSCGITELPEGFSAEDFLQAVDDFVVGPMRETQEMFDSARYSTRLYTTLSAHEMTLDPSFDFNPDLEDVSNVHTAERYIECSKSVEQFEAPWRVELPSGLVVRGQGNAWPLAAGDDEMMPATISVSEVGTSGPGTIVRDNLESIRRQLDLHNAAIPSTSGGCGGCRTTDGRPATDGGFLLVLVGLVGLGMRRRVRR